MFDDEKLIPDLINWRKKNGASFSIDDWTSCNGNISLAICYSNLFWPEFEVYDGCVILKSNFGKENFESWKTADYIKHYVQIEYVLNHIHILDLFSFEQREEPNIEQIRYLGAKLCEIYTAKLKLDFPDLEFVMASNFDEDLEDYLDYEFSFYQKINVDRKVTKTTY